MSQGVTKPLGRKKSPTNVTCEVTWCAKHSLDWSRMAKLSRKNGGCMSRQAVQTCKSANPCHIVTGHIGALFVTSDKVTAFSTFRGLSPVTSLFVSDKFYIERK